MSDLLALSENLAAVVAAVQGSVVAIPGRRGISGIHWRDGAIVTSAENLRRQEEFTLVLSTGQTATAHLAGRDDSTDVAVLRLSGITLPAVTLAGQIAIGHLVLAVGHTGDRGIGASLGILSSLGPAWRSSLGATIDQYIRPDLAVTQGFAGSALVDAQGAVIGMNTTGPRFSPLTIPATTVDRVVARVLAGGRVTKGYLGLGMQPVAIPERLQQTLQLTNSTGVIVVSVEAGGPADQAGILLGDVIVECDRQPTPDLSAIQAHLEAENIGKSVLFAVIRGGDRRELPVTIGEKP